MNLTSELKEYFCNKRVIIVGPSPHLIDKNKGEFIDTYDIVCGVNNLYNLNNNDYGSRIDVLFETTNNESIDILQQSKNKFTSKNIKYLIGTHRRNHNENKISYENFCRLCNMYTNDTMICHNISNFSTMIEEDYLKKRIIYPLAGCHTGTIALLFLLQLPLKELYIEGITFYNNGKFGYCWPVEYQNRTNLSGNSHQISILDQKNLVNTFINKCNFKVDFDENYCPLKKNNRNN